MTEPDFVPIVPRRITQLADLVGASRVARVTTVAQRLLERVGPRTLWHVNSTATGGGVAEMLHALLGYVVDLGVETRWVVIDADGDFFALTKRLHNRLHGAPTGHGFDDADRSLFDAVSARNADTLVAAVRPGDMVVLHDPQTAGLAPALVKHGATVVWRCHIGIDRQTPVSLDAWDFLRADILPAQAHVFSRATYRPDFLPAATTAVIPPSIDPFAIKHQELDAPTVIAILQAAGLLVGKPDCPPVYAARDGSSAVVVRGAEVVADELPRPGVPLAAQVSRWDRLKDMAGVMKAFAEHVVPSGPGYLILAGPQINGVADDPEGAEVYNECLTAWRELPLDARRRVMLANLPMADVDENAVMVNALQRYATV
ncbi:MAG TPA: hypothetical protein VKB69_02130, partial [Micromonosporaceae bacterium]|nr:hypothetical protein [Micromonosporaceae bacterium]